MKTKIYIEGERIYLREVSEDDVRENYHQWLNDEETNQFMETRFCSNTLEDIKQYVRTVNENPDEVFLAICLKDSDEHVGNIKIGAINRHHDFGDISFFIGAKEYWGQGLASEAIKLASQFAFNELKLNKLKAGCYAQNVGAQRALQKAGFSQEGILKKCYHYNSDYTDVVLMGLNRE